MSEGRKSLNFDTPDLSDFQPRQKVPSAPASVVAKEIDRVSSFPSREPPDDGQLNIKISKASAVRFRTLAKAERYKLGEFLEILMNAYEQG